MNKNDNSPAIDTTKVLALAGEIVERMTDEILNRKWWAQTSEMTDEEKALLFKAIADGFNDSTEE